MFCKTDRISLRQVEPSDARLIYQWENDTSNWQVSDTITPLSQYHIEQFILNAEDIFTSKQLRLMIDYLVHDVKITIGAIDMYDYDPRHRRAGVGILIDDAYRNKGFASEALQLLEKYSFEVLCLHQLYCFVSEYNEASIALFKRRGFELTGKRKQWILQEGKWIDQLQYQLISPYND
jgi:diamine N-acetyltransferase